MDHRLSLFFEVLMPRHLAMTARTVERLLALEPAALDPLQVIQRSEIEHMLDRGVQFFELSPQELIQLPLEGRPDHELAVLYEAIMAAQDRAMATEGLLESLLAYGQTIQLAIARSKTGSRCLGYGHFYSEIIDELTLGFEDDIALAHELAELALGHTVRAGKQEDALRTQKQLAQLLVAQGRADDAAMVLASLLRAEPLEPGLLECTIDVLSWTTNAALKDAAMRRFSSLQQLLGNADEKPWLTSHPDLEAPRVMSAAASEALETALSMDLFDGVYTDLDILARVAVPHLDTLPIKALPGHPGFTGPLPTLPWTHLATISARDPGAEIEPFEAFAARVGCENGGQGLRWHFASWPGLGVLKTAAELASAKVPHPDLAERLSEAFAFDPIIQSRLQPWLDALKIGEADPHFTSKSVISFTLRRLRNHEHDLARIAVVKDIKTKYGCSFEPNRLAARKPIKGKDKTRSKAKASRQARRKNR